MREMRSRRKVHSDVKTISWLKMVQFVDWLQADSVLYGNAMAPVTSPSPPAVASYAMEAFCHPRNLCQLALCMILVGV